MRPFGKTWKIRFKKIKPEVKQDLLYTGLLTFFILPWIFPLLNFTLTAMFNGFSNAFEIFLLTFQWHYFLSEILLPGIVFTCCTIFIRFHFLLKKPRKITTNLFIILTSLRFLYFLPLASYLMSKTDWGAGMALAIVEFVWSFIGTPIALAIAYRKSSD